MFNLAIVIFVGFELCYYLLIAQTGIVEVLHSNLFQIALLPIGGILGSYLSSHLDFKESYKIYFLLLLQIFVTFFYPNLNMAMLFLLGLSVGGMAPLVVNMLKKVGNVELILSLCLAYTIGTLLFNYNPYDRKILGLFLSISVLVSFLFRDFFTFKKSFNSFHTYPIFLMAFWAFLDSSLFETLSRDAFIPIWREESYLFPITLFHIVGVIAGVYLNIGRIQKSLIILFLFMFSYIFYFLKEPNLLSIVYPFVISFYNVAILQSLIMQRSVKALGIYMIFIGWIASGAGLFVALEKLAIYVPIAILATIVYKMTQIYKSQRRFIMVRLVILALFAISFSFGANLKLSNGIIKAHTEVLVDSHIDPYTKKIDAKLHMDDGIESLRGKININTFDLISDNKKRDEHMYEALQAKVFPEISFELIEVEKAGNKYKLGGFLNLHGISHRISVPCEIDSKGKLMDLQCKFSIKMTDYNIKQPTLLFLTVRDKVDINAYLKLEEEQ